MLKGSLQKRIIILASGGTLVVLAFLGALSTITVDQSVQRTLQERLNLAQATAQHVDYVIKQNLDLLQAVAFADGVDIQDADLTPERRALRNTYFHTIFGDGVYIVARSGQVLWREPSFPDQPLNYGNYPHIREAFDSGKPIVSDIYVVEGTGRPVVSMVIPIKNFQGEMVGLVGGDIDLTSASLQKVIQPIGLGPSGYVEVVDSKGVVIAASRQAHILRESDHSNRLAILIQQKLPRVSTCHDCHESTEQARLETTRDDEVMAFVPLEMASWGLVIREAEKDAFAPAHNMQRQFLFLGLPIFVISLLLAWGTAQSVIKPVVALTRTAERIAGGDLSESTPHFGEDEIGKLALTFEAMRLKLKESLESFQRLNKDLESRVAQRTKELRESEQRLVRSNRELSLLNAVAGVVTQSLDLDTVLRDALAKVLEMTGVEAGAVIFFDETGRGRHTVYNGPQGQLASVIERSMQNGAGSEFGDEVQFIVDLANCGDDVCQVLGSFGFNSLIRVPLCSKGRVLGQLWFASGRDDLSVADAALLASVGRQIGMAVENALLYREILRKEQVRGELLRKVISAQEEERKRIARELHDETSQSLAALVVALETAALTPFRNEDDVRRKVENVKTLATRALDEIHNLIFDLRPSLLDDLGLIPAINWYAESRLKSAGVKVHVEASGDERRMEPQTETVLFRVVQEAITNIAKHANAENVAISLEFDDASVVVEIEDDGDGFDVQKTSDAAKPEGGFGLLGMRERISLLEGKLVIESEPDGGTTIRIEVPINRRSDQHAEDKSSIGR